MDRFTASERRFRRLAIVSTVGICVLVVAGGVVRLTGSGLGCDDWPNCNDTKFIDVSSGHAAIEQVNRILSGLIGVPVLLMAVAAFRIRPRRRDLRWPSVGVLVSVLANGVVGGIAVRRDLHPALVQSHFLLAMIAIAFGTVAILRSRPGARPLDASRPLRAMALAVGAGTALALITGTVVTGTGPHAGEEDVRRFGFDISDVARIHSVAVLVTIALMLGLVAVARTDRRVGSRIEATMSAWTLIAVMQGAVGYVQYFNGVPEILVGIHLLGATVLWVATVVLVARVVGDGRDDTAATEAPEAVGVAMTTGVSPSA